MGQTAWAFERVLEIVSAAGVIAGLFFNAHTIREETKARKISNLLAMTASHRDVWQEYFLHSKLWRITDPNADISKAPIRPDEEVFVNRVILHLSSIHEALKEELIVKQEGLRRDTQGFFSLPIPLAVWQKTKLVQNRDFVAFVEECRHGIAPRMQGWGWISKRMRAL